MTDPLPCQFCGKRPAVMKGKRWKKTGWIKNPPAPECKKTFEEMKAKAMKSDHGEERKVVDRLDGSGADCYCRETEDSLKALSERSAQLIFEY